jgi:hypothetical protein
MDNVTDGSGKRAYDLLSDIARVRSTGDELFSDGSFVKTIPSDAGTGSLICDIAESSSSQSRRSAWRR